MCELFRHEFLVLNQVRGALWSTAAHIPPSHRNSFVPKEAPAWYGSFITLSPLFDFKGGCCLHFTKCRWSPICWSRNGITH